MVNEKDYFDKNLGKVIKVDGVKIGELNVFMKNLTNKIHKKREVVAVDIDMDTYVTLEKELRVAKNVSKYPTVDLDYTILMKDKKYSDLKEALKGFKSSIIKNYRLIGVYEDKYTIRYTVGSDTKTLEQNDLAKFKDRMIDYIRENGLDILE